MSKWTIEEENFLISNYKNGSTYCAKILNKTKSSIFSKARKLKLEYNTKQIYKKEILEPIVKSSFTIKEVLQKLSLRAAGGNYKAVNKYIKIHNIDISHFETNSDRCKKMINFTKKDISEFLIENSNSCRYHLKKRLFEEGYLDNVCCLCGQDENWNGMKISLIIDHINGISNDNRLENLRIVCPNCNAGLDTFAGRNIKKINIDKLCKCGKSKDKKSTLCSGCNGLIKRKVNRPPYIILKEEIEISGYNSVGRKYNVAGNTIKMWLKAYEK